MTDILTNTLTLFWDLISQHEVALFVISFIITSGIIILIQILRSPVDPDWADSHYGDTSFDEEDYR